MKQVDQVSNSKGEKKDYSAGVLGRKQSDEKSYQSFAFGNSSEAEDFYYFAAQSSDVEWAFGETAGAGYVGTDYHSGSNRIEGLFEKNYGESLLRVSHSHPGAGGPPSMDVYGTDRGDLNNAARSKFNYKREVYDVPNQKIWEYDKNSYDEVKYRGYQMNWRRK